MWYCARVVARAGADLDDAPEAADSGAVEAQSGARQADAGAEQAPGSLARLPDSAERVQDYAGRSKSEATIRAYAAGWRDLLAFCSARGLSALPASDETVAAYLAALADRGAKAATIARRLVIMSQTGHRSADMVRRYIREGSLFRGEWTELWQRGALL